MVRTMWSGTTGGGGLTQLAVRDVTGALMTTGQVQSAVNAVRAFWDGIKGLLPDEVTLNVSSVVDGYEIDPGNLAWSAVAATPAAAVIGTSATSFSMAAGVKANLNTDVIRFGRRVRGAIYIVPATTAAFSTSGLVAGSARTTINTAGATLRSSLNTAGLELGVWSRPITEGNTRPGFFSICSGIETNEKTAILRGRRD